jgi:hypothetical protein
LLDTIAASNSNSVSDIDNRKGLLWAQAERIAVNRTVAGVHYPIDTWAGATLGRLAGNIVLALCGAGAVNIQPIVYDPKEELSSSDFDLSTFSTEFDSPASVLTAGDEAVSVDPASHFQWLWGKVLAEYSGS